MLLASLTEQLGLTTGSFYYHFKDFPTFRRDLADFYGREHLETTVDALNAEPDPLARIVLMRDLADELDIPRLDLAMRVWATTDEHARRAQARLDTALLDVLGGAFRQLGFSAREARRRATLAYAAGVGGQLLFAEDHVIEQDYEATIAFLTTPVANL